MTVGFKHWIIATRLLGSMVAIIHLPQRRPGGHALSLLFSRYSLVTPAQPVYGTIIVDAVGAVLWPILCTYSGLSSLSCIWASAEDLKCFRVYATHDPWEEHLPKNLTSFCIDSTWAHPSGSSSSFGQPFLLHFAAFLPCCARESYSG